MWKRSLLPTILILLMRLIEAIMKRTWMFISDDIIRALQYNLKPGRDYAKKDEVIEVVLDANRLETFLQDDDEIALVKRFRQLTNEEQIIVAKEVFALDRYF